MSVFTSLGAWIPWGISALKIHKEREEIDIRETEIKEFMATTEMWVYIKVLPHESVLAHKVSSMQTYNSVNYRLSGAAPVQNQHQ